MKSNNNKIIGKAGEIIAENFLLQKGFEILYKNYRTLYGEIDLIGKKNCCFYFFEVKSRVNDDSVKPFESVNKKKIDSALGFSAVKELPDKWEEVKAKHKQAWQRLFKYEVGELEVIASRQVFSELLYFKEKYGRNYLDYYLKAVGSDTLARLAGVEVLKQAIENIENDRNKVYRAVKKLEEARKEIQLLREEPVSSKTLATLYKELKEKVNLN